MNKHCYRMVFNKARGILMAVAEIAVSHGKASGETSGRTVVPGSVRGSTLRALTLSAWATLAVNTAGLIIWPVVGQAQIVADPNAPANQRPTVLAAPNGVPLVNIQTPSAAGVSRNTYSQFDVQQQGAILNNSRINVQTQLGGWVQGNPWLATGSARVILNEVNSSNPSLLQGYVEVAGSRAQVIIANPAGVTCNGGGFINASRATLTTGTPILTGGNLEGYRVQGGVINIAGAGLDTSTVDYTDLIARAVQVNAGIWANQLKVTTGANQVDAEHTVATPIAGTGAAPPAFAIDVAQLGGMYAGKITLIGTEAGMGVRNAGNIGASVGEVIVTAEGRLENAGCITSASHTQIDTDGGIDNSGTIYAQGNASLTTRDNIDNSGVIAALGNATLAATGANSQVTSTNGSVLGAGVQTDGSIGNSGALSVNVTKTLTAQGQNLSGGEQTLVAQAIDLSGSQTSASDLHLSASQGDIDLTGATIAASQTLTANASQTLRTDQATLSAAQINASAHDLSNVQGEIVQVGNGELMLNLPGNLDNTQGRIATNSQDFNLAAATLINADGMLEHAGAGTFRIEAATLNGVRGQISSNGIFDLKATSATLDSGYTLAQQLLIDSNTLSNRDGMLIQTGAGATILTASAQLDNTDGVIASNGQNLFLQSDLLNNSNGSLTLTGTGLLTVRSGSLGNNRGMLVTNGGVDIMAASLDNSDGTIYGTGNLTLQSTGGLSNQRGLIQTDADLNVAAVGAVNNANGRIEANGAASSAVVSGASIDNTAGRIVNNGTEITVVSGASIANNNVVNIQGMGVIGGNGEVVINTANLVNTQDGQVVAGGNLNLNTSSSLNNNAGVLFAQANLTVNQPGATLSNAGGHIGASGDVDLTVTSLDNTNGQIGNMQDSGGNLGVLAIGNVTNTGGEIASDQDLRMTANALVGEGAVIGGRDASLSVQGDYTQTAGNLITANRDLSFSTTGNLTNIGTLQAVSNLVVNAANITNQGDLGAGDKLSANTATLRNTGSIVGGDVAITASQKIENVGPSALIGASNALGKLELLAPTIENRDETTATDISALTTIFGLGQVVFAGSKDAVSGQYTSAGQVVNTSGLIQSGGDMSIHADTLTNTRRVLVASNTFTQVGQANGSVIWTIANPDVPGGRYIEPPHEGTWNSHYVQTDYTGTFSRNSFVSISPEARIISGGNLNPAVNLLQNYWSKVTAAGDISLNGVTLDQDSWRGAMPYLQRAKYNGTYLYQNYKGVYWRMAWLAPQTIDAPLPGYDSSFIAQGNISGSGATIHNTAGSTNTTPLGMQAGQTIQAAGGVTVGVAVGATVGSVGQPPVLANLSLPPGGLFHTNTESQARYLVETNPAFANRAEWLSSDWYFQRLRMDPTMIQKRLGDGFYEQKLVREKILSLTGKAMLGGYANEEAQFREMMTAGATLVQALAIRPGISLNAEQVAKLTSNVIIMETRVVDGNSVLVPVVYLARINQDDLLPTGSMIAATNINLTNIKGFTNSGTIKANNALSLSGQAIDNRGGNLQSGGLMALNTAGDIDFTSASVKAGSLQLQTGHDLKLNTDAKTMTVTGPGGTRTSTMLGRVANLEVAGDALIQTGGNLEQKGAQLKVGGDLATDIQGDWQITTQQTRETTRVNRMGGHSFTDTVQNVGSVIQVGGQSDIKTGGSLIAQGAQIDLQSGGSIQAGGSVELQAAKNSFALDATSASKRSSSSLKTYDETVVGTSLQSGQSLSIQSGKDIRLAGSTINVAEGSATLAAAGDVTIQAESEQHTYDWQHSGKRSGIVSTTTTSERDYRETQIAQGSTISADGVTIQSGKDIVVTGSNVVGTNDVTLTAQNNVKIEAATNTLQESHFREEKKSGLLSSGGIGFTLGSQQQSTDAKGTSTMAVASTVGSTAGNVTIAAGNDYKQVGSNVMAPQGDIDISAKKIDITEAQNTSLNTTETKFKQSGITLALTSPVISAIQTAQHMGEAAGQAKDVRMQALAGATVARSAKNAYDAVQAGQGQTINGKDNQIVTKDADGNPTSRDANAADKVGGISVSISVGSSKSQSNSTQTSSTAQGSTVAAGKNVNLTATGAGKDSDLTIQGSQVTVGSNVTLKADDEINLLAAKSTAEQHSTNKSSSGSMGVSFGSQTGVTLAASQGRGNADGSDVSWTNTHVEAGNTLALQSGGDTTLKGAVANGKQVVADVGGNLNVESLQDTSSYESKQKNISGSVTIGASPSGSFSSRKSNINSNYASVTEQTGIKTGDEGFQVNVNGNTDLKGAVIASTDKAAQDGKNSLATGTLTVGDIQNRAEYSANSSSVGASLSYNPSQSVTQNVGDNLLSNAPRALVSNLEESGNQSSVSRSAITQAAVNIINTDSQQSLTGQSAAQTIANLNHDTASAHAGALERTPDVEEIRQRQAATMEIVSTAAPLLAQTINNIYDKRIADYNRQYDDTISAAKAKEAQATALEANGKPDEAKQLNDQAQALRTQAIESRNERDAPKLSRELAQTLGTVLIGGLATGQVDLGQAAASYTVGTVGDSFVLNAQRRDHDRAQGIEVTCIGKPPECAQAASRVASLNDPKVPLEARLKALEDTGQFAIKIVDGNSNNLTNVAINGINNEPDRALVLAVGELRDGAETGQKLYLSYNDAQGGVTDVINVAIDKFTGAESNVSRALGEAFVQAGEKAFLYAHSGGTTVSNVMLNALADNGYSNSNIRVDYFGPAASMPSSVQAVLRAAGMADKTAAEQANWLRSGDVNGPPVDSGISTERPKQVYGMGYMNEPNDSVATFVGFNLGQGNAYNQPDAASKLAGATIGSILQSIMEVPALLATPTSAHSVYRWNNPATWPGYQSVENKETP